MRRCLPTVLAIAALCLSGCAAESTDASVPAGASTTTTEQPAAATSAATSSSKASTSSPSAQSDSIVALDQKFTTPDGLVSFRYPTGWSVAPHEESNMEGVEDAAWELTDTQGEPTLLLRIRPYIPPAGPGGLESILPQGPIPGVLDGIGNPVQTVVAGSFGHDGSSTGVAYGAAAGTGADTTLFDIRWGNHHILSFAGGFKLGSYDQVDLPAETQQFAASPRFRQEILPILQSLTAGEPPAVDSETTGSAETTPDTDMDTAPEGMTPGDISRWSEDLEDEYLAQYGYTEFMDAEEDAGSVPSAIITFDATTYGELRVYTWAWISEDDAQTVAEDVASAMAGLPDAPHTVTVSNGADDPTLATATVND